MTEVVVTVRWEGNRLNAGPFKVGEITAPQDLPKPFHRHNAEWIGTTEFGHAEYFDTEAEARAAVEQAAIKALKGE